jgi:hypothetical protein
MCSYEVRPRSLFRSPLSALHHRRSQACGIGVLNNPPRRGRSRKVSAARRKA